MQRSTFGKMQKVAAGLLALLLGTVATVQAQGVQQAHIYFTSACADCGPYVDEILVPTIQDSGWQGEILVHDALTPEGREALGQRIKELGIPSDLYSYLYAFVPLGEKILIVEGHVPQNLVAEALSLDEPPSKLILRQEEMHGTPIAYQVWDFQNPPRTFAIGFPLAEALEEIAATGSPMANPDPLGEANLAQLLPLAVGAGLLDSVNPCAFAVILLLIAFLFTLRQSRARVVEFGAIYIAVIFLVYFAIGLGLLQAVTLSDDPHFVARAGSILLIVLGLVNIKDYFFPQLPIHLGMPVWVHKRVNELLKKASRPATAGVGFLVGLCTFPCSGGIYVSIITLLGAKTTLAWGLTYLFLYNFLFIAPLILILALATNRVTAKAWASWERVHTQTIHLLYGVTMVALGLVVLFWMI